MNYQSGNRGICISNSGSSSGSKQLTRITDLAARLGIKWRVVENDAALSPAGQLIEIRFSVEDRQNLRVGDQCRVVAVKRIRADLSENFRVNRRWLGFSSCVTNFTLRLQFLMCRVKAFVKVFFLKPETLFLKINTYQVARRAEGVV